MGFRRRTRMISFRVSENEFEQLRNESESHGVGSVSDYARLNLCRGQHIEPTDPLEARLHQLDGKVQTLSTRVERLVSLVEQVVNSRDREEATT